MSEPARSSGLIAEPFTMSYPVVVKVLTHRDAQGSPTLDMAMTPDHEPEAGTGLAWHMAPLTPWTASELATEWHDLAHQAREKNLFLFPWFVIPSVPMLTKLGAQIVTIRDRGLLVGLFLVRRDLGYAKLPVPFLRTAMHYGQYLGTPLVRAGHETRFAEGLGAWLDSVPLPACFLKLQFFAQDGPVMQAIARWAGSSRRPFMIVNRIERAAIIPEPHHGGAADGHISTSRRKSVRRSMHSLEKLGPVTVERAGQDADIGRWFDDFLRLEHASWKGRNGSSILSCPVETTFYRAMVSEAFRIGCLDLSRLCVGGVPIAYTLDVTAGGEVYCLKTAFDPEHRKHAPGVILEYEGLKHYRHRTDIARVDSCTAPGNALLNELWPHRKALVDLVIARRGLVHATVFRVARRYKRSAGLVVGEADG